MNMSWNEFNGNVIEIEHCSYKIAGNQNKENNLNCKIINKKDELISV